MLVALGLAACTPSPSGMVDAARYDAFWLWAGVAPQPVLARAKTIYLLDGEVRRATGEYVALRPGVPLLPGKQLWFVVRVDTLDWRPEVLSLIVRRAERWGAAGNNVAGVQVDFDARTRHLDSYASFLRAFRTRLPRPYKLSVTGLLDWSANGDPAALQSLASVVDEVVIQTYQGRRTIPGYDRYFARIDRLRIPFRVGLVQHGDWHPLPGLARNPYCHGYVVFLVNARPA